MSAEDREGVLVSRLKLCVGLCIVTWLNAWAGSDVTWRQGGSGGEHGCSRAEWEAGRDVGGGEGGGTGGCRMVGGGAVEGVMLWRGSMLCVDVLVGSDHE